jgi:hypothetical protein
MMGAVEGLAVLGVNVGLGAVEGLAVVGVNVGLEVVGDFVAP